MKKYIFLLLLFLSLSCSKNYNYFFKKHTNINLPKSGKEVQIYDYYYITIGKYIIDDQTIINDFIKNNRFQKIKNGDIKNIIKSDNYLEKEYRVKDNKDEFYYKSGKTEKYKWNILINKISGELWIEVLYPEFSEYNE